MKRAKEDYYYTNQTCYYESNYTNDYDDEDEITRKRISATNFKMNE
jgi:hypothetical protein